MIISSIFLIFILLTLCLNIEEEDEIIESIKEGIKFYIVEHDTPFTFNAIDNGNYIFFFEYPFEIVETSGKTSVDIKPDNMYHLKIYAQNFTKGDYFKIKYPINAKCWQKISSIRIEKIDGDFRLFFNKETSYFHTLSVNNCQRPIYIFAKNEKSYNADQYTFNGQVHFGAFKASYKTTAISLNKPIYENFTELLLNNLTDLPFYPINIIKLQCLSPGLITLYFTKQYNNIDKNTYSQNKITSEESIKISKDFSLKDHFYIQGINIIGCTNVNLIHLEDKEYKCTDFYIDYDYEFKLDNEGKIIVKNEREKSLLMFTFITHREDNQRIIEEKTKTTVNSLGKVVIPLNKTNLKKYIKVKSSNPQFYWMYEFSLTNDINYLGPIGTKLTNYEKSNETYIINPYIYNNDSKTNYKWFVSLYNDCEEKNNYYFRYVNEIGEEEEQIEGKNENEKDKKPKKTYKESRSLLSQILIWIINILIIVIIFLMILFWLKKKRILSSDIEKFTSEE